jgi:DNA ligase (NAD+)
LRHKDIIPEQIRIKDSYEMFKPQGSKARPLARLIFGLGIRHVGEQMAGILAGRFLSLEILAAASTEDLTSVPGIGPKIAESVVAFFRLDDNQLIVQKLRNAGVQLSEETSRPVGVGPFSGLEFVITGTLRSSSKELAREKIRARGGTAKDDLTRKTTYLVAGADPGSKLARAGEWGVKVINEEEFLRLLEYRLFSV